MSGRNRDQGPGLGEDASGFKGQNGQSSDDRATIRLSVAGAPRSAEAPESVLDLYYRIKAHILVDAGRDAVTEHEIAVDPEDLIEIEMVDGTVLWIRSEEIEQTFGIRASRGEPGSYRLPTSLATGGGERGIVEWGIKALKVIGIDVAENLAIKLAHMIEELDHPLGVFRLPAGGAPVRIDSRLQPSGKPWLVFLHGTFSSGRGSFGDLFDNRALWDRLVGVYGDQILSLEHRTATASPMANAVELMKVLPVGAELHLVSHSRGGLIGELLCRAHLQAPGRDGVLRDRAAFDEVELRAFEKAGRASQKEELETLGQALAEIRPLVTRFVRVACPARGTTLASERLDKWLNLLFNALGLALDRIPLLGTLHGAIKDLAIAVAAERADPDVLPGLEAMMPEGAPLIGVLNRGGVVADADLRIIQGDIEAGGRAHRLKVWFSDAFYRGDHDLVVDTPSMSGGLSRRGEVLYVFDRGSHVDHFSYFRADGRTAELVIDGLLEAQPARFSTLDRTKPLEPLKRADKRASRPDRATLFLLPGITGSYLDAGEHRAWINIPWLGLGALRRLQHDADDVTASGLVAAFYEDLHDFFARDHNVRPWPYDWRRSTAEAAELFATELAECLDDPAQTRPVRIVAHSMGGLVVRLAFQRAGLADKFKMNPDNRIVMLGTPSQGSWAIASLLTAQDFMARSLALLDLSRDKREVLQIIARFPGVLELLPHNADEVFTQAFWHDLADRPESDRKDWHIPDQDDLDEARKVAHRLAEPITDLTERLFYIAGHAKTIDGLDPDEKQRINFSHTHEGDGRVTWRSGIPAGARTWYVEASHGDLPKHRPAYEGLREILASGDTARLSQQPPPAETLRSREAGAMLAEQGPVRFEAKARIPLFPDELDIVNAALGGTGSEPPPTGIPVAEVKLVNGDLTFARDPILVGHYRGDTISGTEHVLDLKLGGRLRQRHALGRYPSLVGTCEVVLDADRLDRSGVVIGLGSEAELSPGELTRAFADGLVALALALDERRAPTDEADLAGKAASAVLIGSGEGGLDLHSCLSALMRGMEEAQRRLLAQNVRTFTRLTLIEWHQVRAIQAWHVLHSLQSQPQFREFFRLVGPIEQADGASHRTPTLRDQDWWRPVQIIRRGERPDDYLEVISVAGGAQTRPFRLPDHQEFVQQFIDEAIGSKGYRSGPASPGRVLFELLWPNELKNYSADDSPVRLQLDEFTANIPWELMDDRGRWIDRGTGSTQTALKPPAIRSGVVRQLVSRHVQPRPTGPTGRNRALVIGDPRSKRSPSEFSPLDGAVAEAKAVAAVLKNQGYHVETLIDDCEPEQVVNALFDGVWSIVHIAAHGVVRHAFEQGGKSYTGVVLGKNWVLGTDILECLPQPPDLAFINCCHLGRMDDRAKAGHDLGGLPQLAAGFGLKLLSMGTGAVIAAGWAIDDTAAQRFAETFYSELLRGTASLGKASLQARRAAYEKSRDETDNTWGAYQVYGDPGWTLAERRPSTGKDRDPLFSCGDEFLMELRSLQQEVLVAVGRRTSRLRSKAGQMVRIARGQGWHEDAGIANALAQLYTDLGDFGKAIELLEPALSADQASLPVKGVEKLYNIQIRHACRQGLSSGGDKKAARLAITEAQDKLRGLVALLGPTQERLRLIASGHKRLAMLVKRDERQKQLEAMEKAYREAAACNARDDVHVYASVNVLTTDLLLAMQKSRKTKLLDKIIDAHDALDPIAPKDRYKFWGMDGRIMRKLCALLAMSKRDRKPLTDTDAQAILAQYEDLWRSCGSDHHLASVIDQFEFMAMMLEDAAVEDPKICAPAVAGLRLILAGLNRLGR